MVRDLCLMENISSYIPFICQTAAPDASLVVGSAACCEIEPLDVEDEPWIVRCGMGRRPNSRRTFVNWSIRFQNTVSVMDED